MSQETDKTKTTNKLLDPSKLKPNEEKSNHMVVALQTDECPVNTFCLGIVSGFGTPTWKCPYFSNTETAMFCSNANKEKVDDEKRT